MAEKRNPELHKRQLLAALERHLGIVSPACKEVNITRKMFYEYMKKDEDFKKAVEDIQEVQLDFVEHKLLKNIESGDIASTIFFMKTRGRKRGYGQHVESSITIDQIKTIEIETIKREDTLLGDGKDEKNEE